MRVFVGLDIDEKIRCGISQFVDDFREFAPGARWVSPESLHVTLKFIGEKSKEEVQRIEVALRSIDSPVIDLHVGGFGFFPTPRAPQAFWIGVDGAPALPALAALVDENLAAVGVVKEEHAYDPHLTLARGAGGSGSPNLHSGDSPNRKFQSLQERLAPLPALDFGTMVAREFFLYQSQLSPGGSRYTKLASFALCNSHAGDTRIP